MSTKYLQWKQKSLTLTGARLLVTRGPDRGRALRITKEVTSIGSGPSCDLVLNDDAVSRQHLSLRVRPEAYVVTDLDSTNGSFLEGHRILSAHVNPGDTVELGTTRLRLEALDESTELPLHEAPHFGRLLGQSAEARRLFSVLAAVAASDATVLLCGETGTGKDLAAQAIHDASARADKPFVVVDCSAIPAGLVEAELFGHEQGAFPGADRQRAGALLEAHGGTVFFDEIGKLPYDLQPKLLRALENRQVRPLGASKPVNVDVRVVAASDRDLRLAVNRGAFREDLFYRLNVVNVQLPPLRERPDDIPLLATHFYRELTGDGEGRLPREQLDALVRHDWPGNVRELRNTIEQMVALSGVAEVPPSGGASAAAVPSTPTLPSYKQAKAKAASEFERRYLVPLLGATRGNVSEAARLARMDRVNLIKLLRKHNINPNAAAAEPAPGRARVPG